MRIPSLFIHIDYRITIDSYICVYVIIMKLQLNQEKWLELLNKKKICPDTV